MEVIVVESRRNATRIAADAICAVLKNPEPNLGLATGSSPLPVYAELVERFDLGEISFRNSSVFLLDEYVGLSPGHPQSYYEYVCREFASHVDLDLSRVHGPDPHAADLSAACREYEHKLTEMGGIDVQLLGLGANGHIGFNEPSSSLGSRTRVKTLAPMTVSDNARFFEHGGVVPRHVLTQGIGTILEASHLVVLAFGSGKADAVRDTVEGPITAMVPSSALQLHPHVTVLIDRAAASTLKLIDYYTSTYMNKPDGQGVL